jgi:hypothetical protein
MLLSGQAIEFQAFLIKVITVGDLPEQLGFPGSEALRRKAEGFADGKKVGLGFKRITASLGLTQAGKQR